MNKALQSGGRTHAHGMAGLLLCSPMAQWRSKLAPLVPKELFIVKAAPRAAGEVMTLSPHDTGTCKPVHD
jgi:hypothetical protein